MPTNSTQKENSKEKGKQPKNPKPYIHTFTSYKKSDSGEVSFITLL